MKAQTLALRIEEVSAEIVDTISLLDDLAWLTVVKGDGRTVGVVLDHVAVSFKAVMDWAVSIAKGNGAPNVKMRDIHRLNARHAERYANATRPSVIRRLNEFAAIVSEQVIHLDDAQLSRRALVPFMDGEFSAAAVIERNLIEHARNHLGAVRATFD